MTTWSCRYIGFLVTLIVLGTLQFSRKEVKLLLDELTQQRISDKPQLHESVLLASTSIAMQDEGAHQPVDQHAKSSSRIVSPSQLLEEESQLDPHFSDIEFLDLFAWELDSLVGIDESIPRTDDVVEASCRPPSSKIPKSCCIGTIAGHDKDALRSNCGNKSLHLYHSLRDSVLEKYVPYSVPGTTTKCDLCRIIKLSYDHNITFGIYGDSMTRQMMEGLECGLLRRGYEVEKPIQDSSYVKYVVASPSWKSTRNVTIHAYFQYTFLPNMSNPQSPGNNPDVNAILTSFGLHYSMGTPKKMTKAKHYIKGVEKMFGHLQSRQNADKIKLLLHRETSAQHFDSEGGDFFWAREKLRSSNASITTSPDSNRLVCVPYQWGKAARWREPPVRQAVVAAGFEYDNQHVVQQQTMYSMTAEEGFLSPQLSAADSAGRKKRVFVLPFFNFTTTLHDFHPRNEDCTHYCYSPYLWWPLWRSLRIAMDKGLENA